MWIANNWKDYEVIDCSCGEKLERWGKLYACAPGPTGHLGYAQKRKRLETHERSLSSQQKRRR